MKDEQGGLVLDEMMMAVQLRTSRSRCDVLNTTSILMLLCTSIFGASAVPGLRISTSLEGGACMHYFLFHDKEVPGEATTAAEEQQLQYQTMWP